MSASLTTWRRSSLRAMPPILTATSVSHSDT